MSLNNLLMDDLSAIDATHLTLPGKANNKSVIIVPQDENNPKITELKPSELQALPEMDVAFKFVTDGVSRVAEMKDIQNEILAMESINRNKAEIVDNTFGGFFGPNIIIEEFSHLPSKTNLGYTKNFMSKKIKLEEEKVCLSFRNNIIDVLGSLKEMLSNIRDQQTKSLVYSLMSLNDDYMKQRDAILNNPDQVISYREQMPSFLDLDVTDLNYAEIEIKPSPFDLKLMAAVSENMKTLLEKKKLKAFILSVVEKDDAFSCFDRVYRNDAEVKTVTIRTLLDFFCSVNCFSYVEVLSKTLSNDIELVDRLHEEATTVETDYQKMYQFVIEKNLEINRLFKTVGKMANIILMLPFFNANAKEMIDSMQHLS